MGDVQCWHIAHGQQLQVTERMKGGISLGKVTLITVALRNVNPMMKIKIGSI